MAFETETPELEINDVGRFNTGDGTVVNGRLQYRETVPGRWYRDYSLVMNTRHEWNFGGEMQVNQITPDLFMTLPNFWEVEVGGAFAPAIQDERLTRGGPSMEKPGSWQVNTELSSSEAAETQGEVAFEYGRTEDGGLTFVVDSELTMQPTPQWQLSISPAYEREVNTQQYVSTLTGGSAATYGGRYIFAHVDRSTYSMEVRLNYTFKPDLTLDFYGEPFAASGRYDHFGELAAARTRLTIALDRSRCRAATSTCSRSAAISSCAGNGGPGARSTWSGSRTASRKRPSAPAWGWATCSAPSAAAATTFSP